MVPEAQFSLRFENSLNQNYVAGCSLLDVGILEMQSVSPRNSAVPELVWSFLDSQLLVRSEFGVPWEEGQFSVDFVLHAFFRGAFVKRFVAVVHYFHVVLAAADIARKGCHRDFRLDFACSHHDCLHDYQTADFF